MVLGMGMVKASALAFAGISAPASPGQGIRRRSVSCMLSTRPLSLQKLPSCDAERAEGTGAAPVNLFSTEPGLFLLRRMDWLAVVQWGDKPADGSSRQVSFQDQQWNHQRAWYVGRGDCHACAVFPAAPVWEKSGAMCYASNVFIFCNHIARHEKRLICADGEDL